MNLPNTMKFSSNDSWLEKKLSYPRRVVHIATTFSGIGALEYAFKRLGIKTKIEFAGDINENCKKSYFANYDITEERWHSDVTNFNAKPYKGKIDLLVGGAPCQAFSIIGDKLGFKDTRGTLFREFARIIKECKPKIFIFENVKGLLKHDNGKTWEIIKKTFEKYCGYDIHTSLLNSKNFGIPQHRERLFCVGFKEKTDFVFPNSIDLAYEMYDFLEDYKGSNYYCSDFNKKILTNKASRIKNLASGKSKPKINEFIFNVKEIEDKYYISQKVANYVLATGTKNFKTSTKTDLKIARPLLQTMHKMHRAGIDNYVTFNKTRGINGLRKLTPRECLRLMGFRDDFNIVVSDTATYMEAGNSIVVDVLIALLKQLDISKYGRNDDK